MKARAKLLATGNTLFLIVLCACHGNVDEKVQLSINVKKNDVNVVKAGNFVLREGNRDHKENWQPANFKGILIGKDSRDKAREIFGEPTWSGEPEDQDVTNPEIWDNYKDVDDFHKNITVMSSLKKKTILMIVSHQENLKIEEVIKIFGDNYEKQSYSIIPCGNGPFEIIEDPNGEVFLIEYRDRGLAIPLEGPQNEVVDIEYRSTSPGVNQNSCQ